jgi:glyoxylase-like metal-dependent hydrolase (beta-lactamase superfamily II)
MDVDPALTYRDVDAALAFPTVAFGLEIDGLDRDGADVRSLRLRSAIMARQSSRVYGNRRLRLRRRLLRRMAVRGRPAGRSSAGAASNAVTVINWRAARHTDLHRRDARCANRCWRRWARYPCPVLRQVAEGVLIHQSEFCQSNAVVVHGQAGVLLIDAGIYGSEMACLANDLSDSGQTVVAGFSTHPHWDHVLWHARFGAAPRYGTARCAATIRDRLSGPHWKDSIAGWIPPDIAEQISWDLFGLITGVPAEMARIPWDGPQVRIIEHQAHAAGHAALLIEERGVLVAGDMLSDVLIPMLDLNDTADPIEDYLAALRLLEGVAGDVDVLVPGHGSIGGADQVHARIDQDRAYVHALRDAHVPSDPRVGPSATYGKDWLPGVHARQLQRLARRSERDGTPG